MPTFQFPHPYTVADSGSESLLKDPTVRNLLLQRAIDQASRLSRLIEEKPPGPSRSTGRVVSSTERPPTARQPRILDSLDRATDGLGSRRVANMLRAFVQFLQDPQYCGAGTGDEQALLAVLDPIFVEPRRGKIRYLTSPALLVIQAILYGHAAWFRRYHHEAHSAFLAYSFLGQRDEIDPTLSEHNRRFVAALISHQTLLRVAWILDPGEDGRKHGKEVAAFIVRTGRLTDNYAKPPAETALEDDELIAEALARTLFSFFRNASTDFKRQLAAALVLTSLCLQCRHLRDRSARLDAIRPRVLDFVRLLTKPRRGRRGEPNLVFFQYGRYVMRHEQPEDWRQLDDPLTELAPVPSADHRAGARQRAWWPAQPDG